VRLTPLWQPRLQLQQLGHVKIQTGTALATVMSVQEIASNQPWVSSLASATGQISSDLHHQPAQYIQQT